MPLWEKLAPPDERCARRGTIERVLRNLENVLNTRRGYGSLQPDFGIRTLTEYSSREAISAALMQDVRECIERYEPRLHLDEIVPDEERSALRLSFTLKCTLLDDPHQLQIGFDTVFNQFDVARR